MPIKIIGGFAKGFSLEVPQVEITRPTAILLRRKLFDWRQNLEGYHFWDLFAGSGAIGLEALSRGAETLFSNERSREAYQVLQRNVKNFLEKFSQNKYDESFYQKKIELSKMDALTVLKKRFSSLDSTHDRYIIFIDPPYNNHDLYLDCLHLLKQENFKGEVWIESDKLKGIKEQKMTKYFKEVEKTFYHSDHFVVVGKIF